MTFQDVAPWIAIAEYELLLFAGIFLLIGAVDEVAVDFAWLYFRLTGKGRTLEVDRADWTHRELRGRAAVLIAAWDEAKVIGHTVKHALNAWPQRDLCLFIGCYRNDPATIRSIGEAAADDPRVRIIINDIDGPTTKAGCLNGIFRALCDVEAEAGVPFRFIMLHDAEDMVDPAALALVDAAMDDFEFVQLPVLPQPQRKSRWIGSHYLEEFAESHGKTLIVRSLLGAGIPAAGVGCAFSRATLEAMARRTQDEGPFSHKTLTEDYELGIKVGSTGGRSKLLRVRGEDGELVATRAYFPSSLTHAVRQKARWLHGIAFQGWDRLGWNGNLGEKWMRMRDRRGPLSAIVLFVGYTLLVVVVTHIILDWFGYAIPWKSSAVLNFILLANLVSLAWRAVMRFAFTAREYGLVEGLRAVLRLPISNIIAMMAARRAIFSYVRALRGEPAQWDKTEHDDHPAAFVLQPGAR
ncbi:glycosyl transferase family protein [Erythrobacter arachoides]|uniref:Glycosyl transferase family protein n=2 Tax=Aurantiacibacter arachoides TaxID=1850444 RepID=A0A844ZWW8_9SPHN|nr:glycosyl transferase family protein [Aurantiacibacter arachoides]